MYKVDRSLDGEVRINRKGGTALTIPFSVLVRGLIEAGFDIMVPKRDPEKDIKLFTVVYLDKENNVVGRFEGVEGKNEADAIRESFNIEVQLTNPFSSVRAVFTSYKPRVNVEDGTLEFLANAPASIPTEVKEDISKLPEQSTIEKVGAFVANPVDDSGPFDAQLDLIGKMEDPFGAAAIIQRPFIDQTPSILTEANPNQAELVRKCKDELGEDCRFCSQNPENCNGTFSSPI